MDKLLESDPELARFVAEMEQTSRMKKTVEKLTGHCWDLCITNANVSRFDSKTESCLVNCVDRFIDSSSFIVKEFSNRAQTTLSSSSSGFEDTGMILEDKFNLDEPKIQPEAEKKSGWKFW